MLARKQSLYILGGIAVLAILLVACATPTVAPVGETPPAVETPPPTTGANELIFAHGTDIGSFDMAIEESADSIEIGFHVYDGLTAFEPGSTTPIPALATSWDASEDGLEWTFHLREGVTFTDGTPFNADAVVYNFLRWWDPEHPQHIAGRFVYWDYMWQGKKGEVDEEGNLLSILANIEKVDDMTVKLTLSRPNASLLNTLAMENFRFASPTAVQAEGDLYGTVDGSAVGTGPYMLEEWVPNDRVVLVPNPNYWGTAPTLERQIWRVIPDATARYLALLNGEVDGISAWASPSPEDLAQAINDVNLQVIYNLELSVFYLGFNFSKPWLQNENVRLAIAHAIDKQTLADKFYAGDAIVAKEYMPPSLWGYNDAIEDYPYDLAKAQEYMDAALAEGVEIPERVIFYVMPVPRAYVPQPLLVGEFIQASLKEIGISVQIVSPTWRDPYLSDLQEDGTIHDLYLVGWVGDNGDPDNFLCVFFCGGDTAFNNDGQGVAAPPDAELDQLLRDAVAETDFETRKAMYEQANQLLHDRVIGVPLVHRASPTIFWNYIHGYVPSPIREDLTYLTKE